MKFKVCFIGGARYSQPLDTTSRKKFEMLNHIGDMFVVGFSEDLRPRKFAEYAHFYLLPQWPWPILRYLTMFTAGTFLALWIIFHHKAGIIVTQSPYEGFAGALAKRVAALFGRRVALVVENHGDFEISLFLQRKVVVPALYKAIMRRVARFALKEADILRAVSNMTEEQLRKWEPEKPLVKFVAWTDMEVFLSAGEKKEYSHKIPRIVLYAGVLIPRKGVHYLFEAFARVKDLFEDSQLWIIGHPTNPDYAEELRSKVQILGLSRRVRFMEAVPQEQLARYMARAYVFVLPSLSEALGRVVFEAMACGTPVIGSAVGGIPEMVRNGETGFLVPPGDVSALAEKLAWMLEHPEEVQMMGKKAREFAASFFSPERYVENYRTLFALAKRQLEGGSS